MPSKVSNIISKLIIFFVSLFSFNTAFAWCTAGQDWDEDPFQTQGGVMVSSVQFSFTVTGNTCGDMVSEITLDDYETSGPGTQWAVDDQGVGNVTGEGAYGIFVVYVRFIPSLKPQDISALQLLLI